MLSSIHPLGERARQNRWWLTVGAFTVGAIASGALVGGLLGLIGSTFVNAIPSSAPLVATAVAALGAAVADFARVGPPGPKRQVNETWIGAFRGWVYGGGFGLELGVGFLTYIVTWAVYAMFVGEILTGSAAGGAVVGAVFGLGRSATLLIAGFVDRPTRLTSFNRALAAAGPVVRRTSSVLLAGLGVAMVAVGMA